MRVGGEALARVEATARAHMRRPVNRLRRERAMKSTDLEFVRDFTRDIPRGLSSRYLSEQAVPQARWQSPNVILDRQALAYDPDNPGRKILVGAFGDKLIGIDDNRHVLSVAGSRSGKSVMLIANLLNYR